MGDAAISPPPEGEPSESSSLTDRLANVLCAPSEVFEEIRKAPVRTSNWLVPLILAWIATVIYIDFAFSQPAILRDMQEHREQAVRKKVAAGQMTQTQADQAAVIAEKYMTPTILKIFGSGGAILASAVGLFLMGLLIWLALKCCAADQVNYMKVVEVCGLALLINVPQQLLRSGLVLWKENLLATASPTLFLVHPSVSNKRDVFLSMIDVVDFWWLAVLSLGVSKVASIRYRTAALVVFGVWYGFRVVAALLTPS